MAQHSHLFNTNDNYSVLHRADDRHMLDALESIEIHRQEPLMNDKPSPILSPLFALLKPARHL